MEFIETPIFTQEIRRLLPDVEYRWLQLALLLRPEAGDLIPGGGGLRKIRWKTVGGGKRGGLRVIYFWERPDRIYLLLPYSKREQGDLTPAQTKLLAGLAKEWLHER